MKLIYFALILCAITFCAFTASTTATMKSKRPLPQIPPDVLKARLEAALRKRGITDPAAHHRKLLADPQFTNDLEIHKWADTAHCVRHRLCALDICADVCKVGSVVLDPWLVNSLRVQRELQNDMPLKWVSLPGSHNSAITKATGVGLAEDDLNELLNPIDVWVYIANHQLSLTDQMNMGIRHMELDIHWFYGAIRICHAGGIHDKELDEFLHDLGIDWDTETIGCFNEAAVTLNQTFVEIKTWMDKNPNEVLFFYFDDQPDLQEWDKVQLVVQAINYNFGSLVFTPGDKAKYFPGDWPSMNQLRALGKRVTFFSRTHYVNMSSNTFSSEATWNEWSPDQFHTNCTVDKEKLYNGTLERILGDSLIYGPFWNGYGGGLIMPSSFLSMMQCGANFICTDQASPTLLNGAVWSWAPEEPRKLATPGCSAISVSGRWMMEDCTSTFVAACMTNTTATPTSPGFKYTLTPNKVTWVQAPAACKALSGGNWSFATPINGVYNAEITANARGENVWISYLTN